MADVDLSLHPEKKPPLAEFLAAVEARLEHCSPEELRAILRLLAHRARPSERTSFLQSLSPPAAGARAPVRQDALLQDISALAQGLAERMKKADTWDDSDFDEEDSLGPYADAVEPLVALFERAREASERGNPRLARAAYEALFPLLEREDATGRGIRPGDIASEVDLPEARARYLRAVYLTTPPERRAPVLLEALRRMRELLPRGPRPFVREWFDISSEPLPGQDTFLSEWGTLLRGQPGSDADAWLREATSLAGGTRGLRELAFSEPTRHPRAFVDLLAALEREGSPRQVLSTAREALEALPAGLPIRAAIAGFLASAAERLHQPDTVRAARWEAFVAQPTLEHLLDVRDSHATEPERARVMAQAARHLEEQLQHRRRDSGDLVDLDGEDTLETPAHPDRRLLAQALLLAHDTEGAHALAAKEGTLGWTYGDNAQGSVVPAFLARLSGQAPARLPRNVAKLWQWGLESATQAGDWYSGDPRHDEALRERLERAHAEVLPALELEPQERERLLEWCLEVARKRASTLVSRKHRRSYDKAAALLAACAEVLWLHGEQARGNVLLAGFREGFRRHRAFQAELDKALGSRPGSRPR